MTPDAYNSAHDDAIDALAAAWLVQRDEGFDPTQAADFARWREADPRHARAIERLEATNQLLGKLPQAWAQPTLRARMEAEPVGRATARVVRFPLRRWLALGAAAALAITATLWWTGRNDDQTFDQHFATTANGYQQLTLADGSVLELNADSDVQVHFTPGERRVALERGEAHFSVAKNPQRPFIVSAGKLSVRAVGTAFNVRLGVEAVEVLVTEGKVRLSQTAEGSASSPSIDFADLVAGQRARVAEGKAPAVDTLPPEAVQESLAWQAPRLSFTETPLADVVQQFNRHNRIQLVIEDPALAARPVGGAFRADNVEAFVRQLENSGEITTERASPDRIVLRSPR